jgi:putative ABC transport system permease protein
VTGVLIDLRHLLRNLRRAPASAVAAVLTLSLTLGAGASIFAVVDAVLLQPPPFAHPETLVAVGEIPIDDPSVAPRAVSYGTFEAWRERAGSMAAIEAFDGTNLTLTERGSPERVSATNVTPGFLTMLGVAPALGRSFDAGDAARPVAIVSHGFWRAKLAGEPGAIGRQLVLGGRAHTIVGILPERFFFALGICDVWRPFPVSAAQAVRGGYRVRAIARLTRPGSASLAAALGDVSRASSPPARVDATPIAKAIAGDASGMLGVLGGAVALAMLIAFTNLAGLLLVRTIDRRRELAVRSALGATCAGIARQLLLEAGALAAIGTAGGVLLAVWTTPAVARLALEQAGGLASREVAVSWRAIVAVGIAASGCALMCGLLPALIAARAAVADVLRGGATPPPRERMMRRVFVSGEVALAFVLLVSMTLVGRSLVRVLAVNPGFAPGGLLTLQLSVPAESYRSTGQVVSFYSALQAALEERLGPRAISIVDELPLTGDRGRSLVSERAADTAREAIVRTASPAYLETMRIRVAAGRTFDRGDNVSAPARVVVSESLAERLFGVEPPIGRQLFLASTAQVAEVIGVVGDVKPRALDDPPFPTVYLSALQFPSHSSIVVVRSARPDADVIATVREEVARLDPNLPVYTVRSMDDILAGSPGVPERRVLTAAFSGFALLAVVLGALGLFGVAAHDVASRRTELALRLALGADPARILGATLAQGALMVGAGLLAGGVLSVWAARALGSVLLTAAHLDVLSVGAPAAILIAAGAFALLPAARRAARTDPSISLRAE